MKLVRFEVEGHTVVGALTPNGAYAVDLAHAYALAGHAAEEAASVFHESMSGFLANGEAGLDLARELVAAPPSEALYPLEQVALRAPVGDPGKIMCIGQNYRDHCEEQNQPIPERAILFAKYSNTLNDPGGVIRLPKVSPEIDYEAELAVVIGGPGGGGREITEADALNHVAGYLCANDVTARDIQRGDGQWVRGKSPDTFFPIGPYLVTADEIPDPHTLDISLTLNGKTMQQSNTSNLIFRIPFLISYLSQTMTLRPGDILSTGTPGGVGVYRKPQVFLQPGDTVSVTIQGLGTLTNTVA